MAIWFSSCIFNYTEFGTIKIGIVDVFPLDNVLLQLTFTFNSFVERSWNPWQFSLILRNSVILEAKIVKREISRNNAAISSENALKML